MATALREGGVYRSGDRWVDANGKEVDAPTKAELAGQSAPSEREFDAEGATREQLEAEAGRRGLSVQGTGKDGYVTVEDFRKALA